MFVDRYFRAYPITMESFLETKLLDAGLKLTVVPPQETIPYRLMCPWVVVMF